MVIIDKEEFMVHKHRFLRLLKDDSIFIYPTDTVYGIGCNAENKHCVEQLRALKRQFNRPVSVIAPGKQWILDNFEIDDAAKEWIDRLPGPYTLILKAKPDCKVRENVSLDETVGVRIPNHWMSDIIEELGVPVVSTSANISGDDVMTTIDTLHPEMNKGVNLVIYEGPKYGKPSTIVNLSKPELEIKERS